MIVVLSGCAGPKELFNNPTSWDSMGTNFAIGIAVGAVWELGKAVYNADYSNDPEIEWYTCTDNWCQSTAEPAIYVEWYTCTDNWCRPTVGSGAIDT